MLKTRSAAAPVVVQVMVLSLFITLFARLWYIQVVGGDGYQAAAQDNAVRDIDVPAPRGLIVDAMGRPLVANRTSWVVTVDRDVLDKLGDSTRSAVLAPARRHPRADQATSSIRRTKTCGETGAAKAPICWNGSPYEPVPVAEDVTQHLAASILEQSRGLPRRHAPRRARCGPTRRRSASTPPTCSATSRRSPRRSSTRAEQDGDEHVEPAVVRRPVRARGVYDRWLRGTPRRPRGLGRLDGPRASRTTGRRQPKPGDTLVTSLDAKVQSVVEQRAQALDHGRAPDDRPGHASQVCRRLRLGRRDGREDRAASSRWPATRRTTPTCGSAASARATSTRSTATQAGTPLLSRADAGSVRSGLDVQAVHHGRRADHGYKTTTGWTAPSSFQVGSRVFKNYESAALRHASPSPRRCSCPATRSSTGSRTRVARGRRRRRATCTPRTRLVDERARGSGSAARPASTCPARSPAGSPTGSGSWRTGRPTRTTTASSASSPDATSCMCSPASSASTAGATAPATRSTSPSARATRC